VLAHGVGVGEGRLVREEVVAAFQGLEVGELHFDGQGFLALGQHQADALPRQRGLTGEGTLHAVGELDLFVALELTDIWLAEVIGLLDGLCRCKQGDHQGKD